MQLATATSSLMLAVSVILGSAWQALAQSTSDRCISLKGSRTCPSFQNGYVRPSNLTNQFPFFSQVNDARSFDRQFDLFMNSDTGYYQTKIETDLQCATYLSRNVTIQWQKTVYCSQFVQNSFDSGCTGGRESPLPRVCQSTCYDYMRSELGVVGNVAYCHPASRLTPTLRRLRTTTLSQDYGSCTDWDSLATTNVQSCVQGIENEGSCGFGTSTDQLCEMCDPSGGNEIPACCYTAGTNLSTCAEWGHSRAVSITPSQTIATNIGALAYSIGASDAPSPTNDVDDSESVTYFPLPTYSNGIPRHGGGTNFASEDDRVFTDGQFAGIVTGCILGALALGFLIAYFLFKRCRRQSSDTEANANRAIISKPWNQSDDGILKSPDAGRSSNEKFAPGATSVAAVGAGAAVAVAAASSKSRAPRESVDGRPISMLSGETDGRGTTIPAIKDQYSTHEIFSGETVVAIYPYNATLNDEITLQPDDIVTVQRLYDDGWALGRMDNGAEGAFPLVCVTSTKGATGGGSGEGPIQNGGAANENEASKLTSTSETKEEVVSSEAKADPK